MPSFPYWQDYPLTLAASTDLPFFDASAAWVHCYAAAEEFEISINSGPWLKFNQGLQMKFDASAIALSVKLRAKSGAAVFPNAITLRLGVGDFIDNRFSVSAPLQIAAGATLKVAKPATLTTVADVALVAATDTQIFAANANATLRIVRNTGTADVRVAGSAAGLGASKGVLVRPGEAWETEVNGALWARSAGTPTLVLAEATY